MPNQGLVRYIEQTRSQNVPDDVIKAHLISAGWSENDILLALTPNPPPSQDKVLPPAPPPPIQPEPHFGMWVGFLYILFFISLYVVATAMGGLFNQWIDKLIPNPTNQLSYGSLDSLNETMVRVYVSSLIVGYPIFAFLAVILHKQTQKQPQIKNLRSRKLLIYTTLVGTFIIMIGNIISTIFNFLGGSVTLNTLGHLGVTFLISGSIFFYFLHEVKTDKN